jgi:hypothetical protein
MKTIDEDNTVIIYTQETHKLQNKVAGKSNYKIFTTGDGRSRAAVVVTNNQIDAILIKQLSDADTVVVEIINGSLKFILVSMYFDREHPIELDLVKIEAVMQHAKGAEVLIAMGSISRFTLWHDTLTNTRGRILEEFITSKQLNTLN